MPHQPASAGGAWSGSNTGDYREELFGPVAVVHRVRSAEQAVGIATESPLGLGAAVLGRELGRFGLDELANKLVRQLAP